MKSFLQYLKEQTLNESTNLRPGDVVDYHSGAGPFPERAIIHSIDRGGEFANIINNQLSSSSRFTTAPLRWLEKAKPTEEDNVLKNFFSLTKNISAEKLKSGYGKNNGFEKLISDEEKKARSVTKVKASKKEPKPKPLERGYMIINKNTGDRGLIHTVKDDFAYVITQETVDGKDIPYVKKFKLSDIEYYKFPMGSNYEEQRYIHYGYRKHGRKSLDSMIRALETEYNIKYPNL